MNLPAHGTISPDPSLTPQHDNENKKNSWLQCYRLALPGKNPTQTAWRDILTAKHQASIIPTILESIAWRVTPYR